MATTTTKLAAAKLNDKKGITNQLARHMFDNLGSVHMAIVELRAVERTEHEGDDQAVKLELLTLEAADGPSADHLRELQRALWRKREPQTDILTLDDVEPTVDEVLQRGEALLADDGDDGDGEDDR